jgi:serine protease Do
MNKLQSKVLLIVMILALMALVACGGNEPTVQVETPAATEASPTDTPAPPPTDTPEPTPEPTRTNAVTSLQDLQTAVIQIEAQGSFIDPEVGLQLNTAGRGSGFIIDPSGIAVTNNHVVTGAALLQVWVGGETRPRNARILGVSECSDLAVIDIDGDDYPYLEWRSDSVNVGLDVYAAGFPLGDPEFTLTRGIVSKARADGETNWASVDWVIEHDATINPGNSGGPLVDPNGQLVGVNYAGASSTNQYFAIARDEAIRIIEQLRAGQDVNSIGINGMAVTDGQSLSGIWVSSVKSGSPADRAGVKGGDIITSLQGLILATDGTMSDYCDILRTHNATDTMNIEVLRFNTQEVLEGQLNGRLLETTFSFAQALQEEVPSDSSASGGVQHYSGYTTVTDDSGTLAVEIPVEWRDVDGSAWTSDGDVLGVSITAAPNLNNYYNSWSTPGVFFGASTDLAGVDEDDVLDVYDFSGSCSYGGRQDYEDPLYSGRFDLWQECGDGEATYIVLAVAPAERDIFILVTIQVNSEADLEALDHILNSFIVIQ